MVLGLKAKTRSSHSVQLEYLIHIKEIKPWPPSQSLRTLRSVLIEWEHGDRHTGSTTQVVPSLGTGSSIGDGRIEFNESFRLPVTLTRETPVKVEFHLYEPRRDKTAKGQLLGTAVFDLAEYGVVRESLSICSPINCKRTYRNTGQPFLFLKLQPAERTRVRPSLRDSLTREASMDRNGSLSRLLSEEYAEESEFTSYTDDDVSSHLSLPASSSANGSNYGSPPHEEGKPEEVKSSPGQGEDEEVLDCKKSTANMDEKPRTDPVPSLKGSLPHASTDLTSDLAWISKKIGGSSNIQHSTSNANELTEDTHNAYMIAEQNEQVKCVEQIAGGGDSGNQTSLSRSSIDLSSVTENSSVEGENSEDHPENGQEGDPHNGEKGQGKAIVEDEGEQNKDESVGSYSEGNTIEHDLKEIDAISAYDEASGAKSCTPTNEILKHVTSVRSSPESNRVNGYFESNQLPVQVAQKCARGFSTNERKDQKVDTTNILLESKIHKLEERVKMLEGELREAAAVEVGLYSVIAEHGCSTNKVHAPARRLSRFYLHACKENSVLKRASAAKSAIFGIYLVAKACGNDVTRLTFWLSNSVVLRASITKFHGKQQVHLSTETMLENAKKKKFSPLKWESCSTNGVEDDICERLGNWEDPVTFIRALEKIEAWIFSRIIESIWWQIFIPHMQSGASKATCDSMSSEINSVCSRTSGSGTEEHGNFSLDHWKKAFKVAYERICPVRAGGHECGCLYLLSKLIMGQCVARLDVAMFNAILRESADEMPSDPISDPITDAKVLPVPAGKASFGAGAQLKNAIGKWSIWLTDLVGIRDGNITDNEDDGNEEYDSSSKPFYLLDALSDLMMLPKDMLLSRNIRKEVCPTFGPIIIRRVLNFFVPDEFCPDPIPEVVVEALNTEDPFDAEEDSVMSYPCTAAPIVYKPPSTGSVDALLGDISGHSKLRRTGSSVLKKSYTSDDELDQLDLNFIISEGIEVSSHVNSSLISKGSGNGHGVRYQLLREVWLDSE